MTKLIIVESPSKVAKIKGWIGDGWRVEASMGHVRDLPDKELGITIADSFRPSYTVLKGKEQVVKRLVKAIKEAEAVYLATDPDREGEAISWHILELAGLIGNKPVHRVTFSSITKEAVLKAVAAPRKLDLNLIEAQQARRVVDRLVGYITSPLVCRALNGSYSAGRVQSVCLRLVVEREQEVRAFIPKKYWTLDVALNTLGGSFKARLASVKGSPIEQLSKEQAEGLIQNLNGSTFWVENVTVEEKTRRPAAPFTTSSLQQAASIALGLSPDKTMNLAQILYEAGLITYMRTDAVSVVPEAAEAARHFIAESYGPEYVPAKPQIYTSKMDNAQEAHEAIRPTDVSRLPDTVGSENLEGLGTKLYKLIWQRFVASQMADERYVQTTATVLAGKVLGKPFPLEFEARGRTTVFLGFLKAYQEVLDDGEESEQEPIIPPLAKGQALQFVEWLHQERTTKAPGRYTEASLVAALEREGIGRPSTFASMVKLIKDKGYARLDKKRLVPTPQGEELIGFLIQHFPGIFDYNYTAKLEHELDRVASGDATRLGVLLGFWEAYEPALKAVGKVVEQSVIERTQPKPTGQQCPKCGGAILQKRSRHGAFLGCSNYPNCKFSAAVGSFIPIAAAPEK